MYPSSPHLKSALKCAPPASEPRLRGARPRNPQAGHGAGARSASPAVSTFFAEDSSAFKLIKVAGTFRFPYSESLANLALPLEVTEQVKELLKRECFDILHVHEPYPPSLSFTALRLAHCPTVATFHTSGERFLSYQLMRPVVERFLARLDGRICTSHNTRRIVSSYFPGDYVVIGSGVDTGRFHVAGKHGPGRTGPWSSLPPGANPEKEWACWRV